MGYNEQVDKVLKEWESETFLISVRSYKEGVPKLQVGPRIVQGGREASFVRLGRLSLDEVKFLNSCLNQVIKVMEKQLSRKEKE